jgi:hypothetical protein
VLLLRIIPAARQFIRSNVSARIRAEVQVEGMLELPSACV